MKEKIKICEKLKDEVQRLDCRDNIEFLESLEIGGHKVNGNIIEGAIIDVFIEKENEIKYGSKFTLSSSGGKGTVQHIIPAGNKPKALDSGLEIDFVGTPMSLISRKNPSILMLLYSGKVIYFLNKKVKELASQSKVKEIKSLVKAVFEPLDKSDDKFIMKNLEKFFSERSDKGIVSYINNSDPMDKPAFPLIVPPFKNGLKIVDIEKAAKILDVPLYEKVHVPEGNYTTQNPVTVGIMPVYYLEHFPKEMSSVRGSLNVSKQSMTGQGRSGTKEGNGAIRLGLYDMFAVSTKMPTKLIKELHALKSDSLVAHKMSKQILNTGKLADIDTIDVRDKSKTRKLVENYYYGAILDPKGIQL